MTAGLDPIKFGTSGWRARMADTYTFANVRRLTRAIADHLEETGEAEHGVVVGYDTRFLSEDFAAAAAGTLAQAGVRCRLAVAAVPTPTVAHAVLHHRAAAGITITASHNPAPDNGLKLSGADRRAGPSRGDPGGRGAGRGPGRSRRNADRGGQGGRARGVRGFRARVSRPVPAAHRPRRHPPRSPSRRGRRHVRARARLPRPRCSRRRAARSRCSTGRVTSRSAAIPPEPAEEHLGAAHRDGARAGAHLGLATDGDADRFGVVDRDGTVLAPNPILALVLRHLLGHRRWRGGVARSVATTHLLDGLAARHGSELHETARRLQVSGRPDHARAAPCSEARNRAA